MLNVVMLNVVMPSGVCFVLFTLNVVFSLKQV